MKDKTILRCVMKGLAIAQCITDHHTAYMQCNYPVYNSKLDYIKNTNHKLFMANRPVVDKRRLKRHERKMIGRVFVVIGK